MITRLRGKNSEAKTERDGPFTIIGERINPIGSKRVADALRSHDLETIVDLAASQVGAGTTILDFNAGLRGLDKLMLLPEVIQFNTDRIDIPICIDSSNPLAREGGLQAAPGKAMFNSVTGEEKSLNEVLTMAKAHNAVVCM
jgi:5-methyltetrahydrofolate--homocysteine methyltransferase